MEVRRMLSVGIFLLACGGVLLAAQTEEAKLSPLHGVWQIEELELNGAAATKDLEDFTLVFAKNYMTYHYSIASKGHADFSIALNTSKTPHEIDATLLNGKSKGQVLRGIYSIDGGMLNLRLPEKPTEPRPTGFSYVPGSSVIGYKARRISQ